MPDVRLAASPVLTYEGRTAGTWYQMLIEFLKALLSQCAIRWDGVKPVDFKEGGDPPRELDCSSAQAHLWEV